MSGPFHDDMVTLARVYVSKNPGTGNLHVSLEDGNLDDGWIIEDMEAAMRACDSQGAAIAGYMLGLDDAARELFCAAVWSRPRPSTNRPQNPGPDSKTA